MEVETRAVASARKQLTWRLDTLGRSGHGPHRLYYVIEVNLFIRWAFMRLSACIIRKHPSSRLHSIPSIPFPHQTAQNVSFLCPPARAFLTADSSVSSLSSFASSTPLSFCA